MKKIRTAHFISVSLLITSLTYHIYQFTLFLLQGVNWF